MVACEDGTGCDARTERNDDESADAHARSKGPSLVGRQRGLSSILAAAIGTFYRSRKPCMTMFQRSKSTSAPLTGAFCCSVHLSLQLTLTVT